MITISNLSYRFSNVNSASNAEFLTLKFNTEKDFMVITRGFLDSGLFSDI